MPRGKKISIQDKIKKAEVELEELRKQEAVEEIKKKVLSEIKKCTDEDILNKVLELLTKQI